MITVITFCKDMPLFKKYWIAELLRVMSIAIGGTGQRGTFRLLYDYLHNFGWLI